MIFLSFKNVESNASNRVILKKLESNFSDVKTEEIVIEEFYNASQEQNEYVADKGLLGVKMA